VPHAHMHLLPINTSDDLNFTREKLRIEPSRLLEIQQLIRSHLSE